MKEYAIYLFLLDIVRLFSRAEQRIATEKLSGSSGSEQKVRARWSDRRVLRFFQWAGGAIGIMHQKRQLCYQNLPGMNTNLAQIINLKKV